MKPQGNASDRRQHPRKEVDIPAELLLSDGSRLPARLRQLSIGGSFIETAALQDFGTVLKLLFRLPARSTEFTVAAVVRWSSPSGMGVQFGAMRAREIYELSEFLVGKPTVEAAVAVARTAPLPTARAKLPVRTDPVAAAPSPPLGHLAASAAAPTPRPAPSRPAEPPARAPTENPTLAQPSPQESELDRARCEVERLANELLQAQDQLERAQADAEQRTETVRSLESQLAERNEQLRKAQVERAPGQDKLRIVEAELELRTEQLRKLGAELSEIERRTQPLVAELATRQAELAKRQSELEERALDLGAREAELARRAEQLHSREAALAAAPAATAAGDDLTRIRGIGPAFARALGSAGVNRFAQIAAWTDADIDRIAPGLKLTPARIRRQEWVRRAAELDQQRQAR